MKKIAFILLTFSLVFAGCNNDDGNDTTTTPTTNNNNNPPPAAEFISFTLNGNNYSVSTANEDIQGAFGAENSLSDPISCYSLSGGTYNVNDIGISPDIWTRVNCYNNADWDLAAFYALFAEGSYDYANGENGTGMGFSFYDYTDDLGFNSWEVSQPASSVFEITDVQQFDPDFGDPYVTITGHFNCMTTAGAVTNGGFRISIGKM